MSTAPRASSRRPSAVSCDPRLVAVVNQPSSVAVACKVTSLASTRALQLVCCGVCWSLRAPPTAVLPLRDVPRVRHVARHRAGPRPSLVTRASSRLSVNPRRSLSLASSLDSLRLGRFDWSVAASFGPFVRRQLRCRSCVTCHDAAPRASSRRPLAISCHPRLVAVVNQPSSVAVACEVTSLASTQALRLASTASVFVFRPTRRLRARAPARWVRMQESRRGLEVGRDDAQAPFLRH